MGHNFPTEYSSSMRSFYHLMISSNIVSRRGPIINRTCQHSILYSVSLFLSQVQKMGSDLEPFLQRFVALFFDDEHVSKNFLVLFNFEPHSEVNLLLGPARRLEVLVEERAVVDFWPPTSYFRAQ